MDEQYTDDYQINDIPVSDEEIQEAIEKDFPKLEQLDGSVRLVDIDDYVQMDQFKDLTLEEKVEYLATRMNYLHQDHSLMVDDKVSKGQFEKLKIKLVKEVMHDVHDIMKENQKYTGEFIEGYIKELSEGIIFRKQEIEYLRDGILKMEEGFIKDYNHLYTQFRIAIGSCIVLFMLTMIALILAIVK